LAKKKPTKDELKKQKLSSIDLAIQTNTEKLNEEKKEVESSAEFAKIELVPIDDIKELKLENDEYMHNRISYSRSKLLELASNIAELAKNKSGILGTGIVNAALLRRSKGRLERIHGDNRIKALKENKQTHAPVIILENVSDELARFMRSSENLNREDLNPYDETLSIIEHIQLACKFDSIEKVKSFINKIKNFKQNKSSLNDDEQKKYEEVTAVFEKIGRFDVITFVDRLKVLTVHNLIKQALVDGEIAYSKSVIINRLKKDEDIVKTLRLAKASTMSDKQIKAHVNELLDKNEPVKAPKELNNIETLKKSYSNITNAKYKKLTTEEKSVVDNTLKEMTNLYSKIDALFH